ncbi:hypothetical protein A3741_28330 [Oleiphilus sp. HI0069]|nr:hypothetical protein A3741_28330 [Oleiphilus sp. HI0069]
MVSFAAEFLWRFSNTENINESFGARLSAWQGASTSIVEHILVGVGSNKSEVASLDSNYVLILYKNGMLGLALYFALFVSVIYASFRKYIKYRWVDPYIEVVSVFCLSSTFIMFVAMITAIPLFMVQLSVPYFMLASYTISLKENPKEGLSAYV